MLVAQNDIKKVDSLGRVTIPVGLRKRMKIDNGTELEVFTYIENDREYIVFSKIVPNLSSSPNDIDVQEN